MQLRGDSLGSKVGHEFRPIYVIPQHLLFALAMLLRIEISTYYESQTKYGVFSSNMNENIMRDSVKGGGGLGCLPRSS